MTTELILTDIPRMTSGEAEICLFLAVPATFIRWRGGEKTGWDEPMPSRSSAFAREDRHLLTRPIGAATQAEAIRRWLAL